MSKNSQYSLISMKAHALAHCMVHHVSYLALGGEHAVKNDSR